MTTVALVVHPHHPEAGAIADRAERWLTEHGHGVVRIDATTGADATRPPLGEGVDLAVSLGGDGTMLRTVALACPEGVPVLGVNLGRLGYLTEVEPSGLQAALERFLAGDYGIEERVTLEVEVEPGSVPQADGDRAPGSGGPDGPRPVLVLNEAAVEKTVPGHTIRVRATIAGRPLVTYAADGLLVATPTGSTAYNLSAHGPILSPGLRAIVLTPVSPHMLFDRPVVLEPEQWVRLEVGGPRPAVLVLDGQTQQVLQPGDAVVCRVGPTPARFVTFGPRDFFAILRARFHLADR